MFAKVYHPYLDASFTFYNTEMIDIWMRREYDKLFVYERNTEPEEYGDREGICLVYDFLTNESIFEKEWKEESYTTMSVRDDTDIILVTDANNENVYNIYKYQDGRLIKELKLDWSKIDDSGKTEVDHIEHNVLRSYDKHTREHVLYNLFNDKVYKFDSACIPGIPIFSIWPVDNDPVVVFMNIREYSETHFILDYIFANKNIVRPTISRVQPILNRTYIESLHSCVLGYEKFLFLFCETDKGSNTFTCKDIYDENENFIEESDDSVGFLKATASDFVLFENKIVTLPQFAPPSEERVNFLREGSSLAEVGVYIDGGDLYQIKHIII